MGILNVTPDSFSDGGKFYSPSAAVDQAKRMEDDGADIIDIGGESTRPYSLPVLEDEERKRVTDVLSRLEGKLSIPISIDTTKATVARAAIELGASILNDVSGLEADPDMIAVAKETGVGVCAMHRQGTPQTMQDNPTYTNVVEEILEYLKQRRTFLISQGIAAETICLDPGIGFGKSHEHNLELIRNAHRFHETGCPILVGHSRKGFIAKILGNKDVSRTAGTIGVSLCLARKCVHILRVHDVLEHKHALQLFLRCQG
jgi:dihydropteroate synthase